MVPRGGNARRLASSGFLLAADVGFQHGVHAGGLPVAGVVAGAGRAGRDFVGVVTDAVIEVVFAKLRPERLELVASHARPGSGGGLVQEDGGDGTAQAMAGPA